MHAVGTTIGFLLGTLIGGVIGFGISLVIVYGLMWLLHSLLDIPYAAASSASFVLFLIGAVMVAAMFLFGSQNKTWGIFFALYSLLATPIMYAAAFNAHRIWTNVEDVGDSVYLPGQVWNSTSEVAGGLTAQLTTLIPALSGFFNFISGNALLTGIVASAFSTLVFQPMAQKLYKPRPRTAHA